MARSKYGAKKITVDGYEFDSKDEARYYEHLLKRKAKGEILNFELQPKFTLIESFKYFGKARRATTYAPDFRVYHLDGTEELIDVKSLGSATQQGELRRKMFENKYRDIKLTWVCRNLKHGNENGWIEYDDLKKVLRENKKRKEKKQ